MREQPVKGATIGTRRGLLGQSILVVIYRVRMKTSSPMSVLDIANTFSLVAENEPDWFNNACFNNGLVWSGLLPGPGHATTCA